MRIAALTACVLLSACGRGATDQAPDAVGAAALVTRACPTVENVDVQIPGGDFTMGANPENPEEGPARRVSVASFIIDRTEVTNAAFAVFVTETGYITLAERDPDPALYPGVPREVLKPSSLVFVGAAANPPERSVELVARGRWR